MICLNSMIELIGRAALAAVPPDVAEAQQLVAALAQKVKNRKTSATRVFSVDQLKKAVEHLSFEMQHFRCYSKLYSNDDLRRFSCAAHQAVRYALLLHYVYLLISSMGKQHKMIAMWIISMFLMALKLLSPPAFTCIAHETGK